MVNLDSLLRASSGYLFNDAVGIDDYGQILATGT
jgi:hypothetical protein